MYVLVGPNGAGKSTLYEYRVRPITDAPFVNADEILKARQAEGEKLDAYEAARVAAELRDQYLTEKRSFVTETVFSHDSKIDLIRNAQAQGFRVVLFHVNVESAEIAVARVHFRASLGGHDVPDNKIRERYQRNQQFIRQAVGLADLAQIFDSSKLNRQARYILTFKNGELSKAADDIPQWAKNIYGV